MALEVRWLRSQRVLLSLVLTATLVPAGALAWLSFRLMRQEQLLHDRRVQDRLQASAEMGLAELRLRMADWQEQLLQFLVEDRSHQHRQPSALDRDRGAVVVVFTPNRVEDPPVGGSKARLLYYPATGVETVAADTIAEDLERAEFLELTRHDYDAAHRAALAQVSSSNAPVRTRAWLLAARNLRKAGRHFEALRAYAQLETDSVTTLRGIPADLLARLARCELLNTDLGRATEAQAEAALLLADLYGGRWRLSRSAFHFYTNAVGRIRGARTDELSGGADRERAAVTEAAITLWEDWIRTGPAAWPTRGVRTFSVAGERVVAIWRAQNDRAALLIGGPRFVKGALAGPIEESARLQNTLLRFQHHDDDGSRMPLAGKHLRSASMNSIPWTVLAAPLAPELDSAEILARNRVLRWGLVVLGGGASMSAVLAVIMFRRELALARMKSDFVSAVSHDFRTPLTAVAQAAELIAEGRVSSEEQRKWYGDLLLRETTRLRRLLESLLEFGRMEGGARQYQLRPIDLAQLVRGLAEEFEPEAKEQGYRLSISVEADSALMIRADADALGRALWNLLYNAMQYSPECSQIWLSCGRRDAIHCFVSVRDLGIGISATEHKRIFRKFIRGSNAGMAAHKGTGIGLSIVAHVVKGHGGRMQVESEPGTGSTFTVLLPEDPGKG